MGIPIGDLAGFLKYGPIGFAAVLLLLGFISAFKILNKNQTILVYTLLVIGVLCFLVSIGVQLYSLHLDKDENTTIEAYKNSLSNETSAANSCRSIFTTVSKNADDAIQQLTKLNGLTGDPYACPGGGPHGQGIPHGASMTSLGTAIRGDLSSIEQAANAALR